MLQTGRDLETGKLGNIWVTYISRHLLILFGKTHGHLRREFLFISSVTNAQMTFFIPRAGVPKLLNCLHSKLLFGGRKETIA